MDKQTTDRMWARVSRLLQRELREWSSVRGGRPAVPVDQATLDSLASQIAEDVTAFVAKEQQASLAVEVKRALYLRDSYRGRAQEQMALGEWGNAKDMLGNAEWQEHLLAGLGYACQVLFGEEGRLAIWAEAEERPKGEYPNGVGTLRAGTVVAGDVAGDAAKENGRGSNGQGQATRQDGGYPRQG